MEVEVVLESAVPLCFCVMRRECLKMMQDKTQDSPVKNEIYIPVKSCASATIPLWQVNSRVSSHCVANPKSPGTRTLF